MLIIIVIILDREVLYYENFNLTDVVTPVKPDILEKLLQEAEYNTELTEFIVGGFRHGFPLGYVNTKKVQIMSQNLKFQLGVGDEIELWNKVMKEVRLQRYVGPFLTIPEEYQDDYIQSPIGLVPKDGGKNTRLIFHLSHPRLGLGDFPLSVNANIPKENCHVKYPDFADAVLLCLNTGRCCYIGKSDFKSAFRVLGLKSDSWHYLIMRARSPLDGKWYFFL